MKRQSTPNRAARPRTDVKRATKVAKCPHCGHPAGGVECRAAAEEAAKDQVPPEMVLSQWDGPVEPMMMNRTLLKIIRQDEKRRGHTKAELGRRCGCSRQHAGNVMDKDMVLTVPMLQGWCNGRKLNLAFLFHKGTRCLLSLGLMQRD